MSNFTMTTHKIWSCHVTLAANLKSSFFTLVCIKVWEKLPDLWKIGSGLVPWPFWWRFLRGGPQCGAFSLWALMSYSIASAWALWPLNREDFSLCSVRSFSQVPTVASGNYNDKSYQRRTVFV